MECVPELAVAKRKTLSSAKMIKRLQRFVRDNQRPDPTDTADQDVPGVGEATATAELVCRVPDETLFQLQQIYEALDVKRSRRTTMAVLPSSVVSGGDEDANESSLLQTPAKKSSKKRPRGSDEPATEKADRSNDKAVKKKKARRKSAST